MRDGSSVELAAHAIEAHVGNMVLAARVETAADFGHGKRYYERRHRELTGTKFRRPPELGSRDERESDICPRHQHHRARRDVHASHDPAGASGRTLHLPGLFWLCCMGSRYLFIVLYCLIERWLSGGDYRSRKK